MHEQRRFAGNVNDFFSSKYLELFHLNQSQINYALAEPLVYPTFAVQMVFSVDSPNDR